MAQRMGGGQLLCEMKATTVGLFDWLKKREETVNVSQQGLSGAWKGFYTQYDVESPITVQFTQHGTSISGEMRDGRTENEQSIFSAAAQAGLAPGVDEQIEAQIRAQYPEAADLPIRVVSTLPEKSVLEGKFDGKFIRFTKTYSGDHFIGYEFGDRRIGDVIPGHSVEYSGTVSEDQNMIKGNWTIYTEEAPKGFIQGGFKLQRTT